MIRTLNPKYQSPSRDLLSNTLIPAWNAVAMENVKRELQDAKEVAVTADGWTSVARDHYLSLSRLCETRFHEGENPAYKGSVHITDGECYSKRDRRYYHHCR